MSATMNDQVTASLDTHGKISPPESSGEARSGGGLEGRVPLPSAQVPPKPELSNMDGKAALEHLKQAKRRVREERKRKAKGTLARIDRTHWYALAGVGVVVLGFLGARSLLGMQRDTALALAGRADTASAVQPEAVAAEPIVVEGIPNPLADLKLTGQARWIIGEVDGQLPATRSATVLSAMLDQVDLCDVYLGLNDRAAVVVSFEPTPGFSPLVQCQPGVVEVPQDLAPPTTVARAGQ